MKPRASFWGSKMVVPEKRQENKTESLRKTKFVIFMEETVMYFKT